MEPTAVPPPRPSHARAVAVIDIGSNSIRLVIFDRLENALVPLYNERVFCALGRNERVFCALGRGLASGALLDGEAMQEATGTVTRFARLAESLGVGDTESPSPPPRCATHGTARASSWTSRPPAGGARAGPRRQPRKPGSPPSGWSPGCRGATGDHGRPRGAGASSSSSRSIAAASGARRPCRSAPCACPTPAPRIPRRPGGACARPSRASSGSGERPRANFSTR